MLKINCLNQSEFPLPKYETSKSAGVDLRGCVDRINEKFMFNVLFNNEEKNEIVVKPGGRALIPTGLFISLPEGYEAQVRPRSGLALKNGISIVNSPGTIDADYRGEIGVILINLGFEDFIIKNGDRIAQMVITKHERVEFNLVDTLDETERGAGGFGSTNV